jgi:hypothetical protein
MLILNISLPPRSYFSFFTKMVLLKVVHPLKIYLNAKLHGPAFEWCKFSIHLRSLNVSHFGMVAATALKLRRRGHFQWRDLVPNFIKIYHLAQNLMGVGVRQAHRQDGDLISLHFSFRKESRLRSFIQSSRSPGRQSKPGPPEYQT